MKGCYSWPAVIYALFLILTYSADSQAQAAPPGCVPGINGRAAFRSDPTRPRIAALCHFCRMRPARCRLLTAQDDWFERLCRSKERPAPATTPGRTMPTAAPQRTAFPPPAPSSRATIPPPATPAPTATGASPAATPAPARTATPPGAPSEAGGGDSLLSAVWANDGSDKVTQDELRASGAEPQAVSNSVWNGRQILLFGARNEVVSFNLVLESARRAVPRVSVAIPGLAGPQGALLSSRAVQADDLFNYVDRPIELFLVRYLQIRGLSLVSYGGYDERHIPKRLRRPHDGPTGRGGWLDRPDHDKFYPDIAVPLEAVGEFEVAAGKNQSIWADIFIPKGSAPGQYGGSVEIRESGVLTRIIPLELLVRNFTLPDEPSAKSMVYLGQEDISRRYTGERNAQSAAQRALLQTVRDRHFQMAHRHKISLIDADPGDGSDQPSRSWHARISGELFTADRGYAGPGEGVGNGVFSIGTYGSWSWGSASEIQRHADSWANWFEANAKGTEYFLYLIDESSDFPRINDWAAALNSAAGAGQRLM